VAARLDDYRIFIGLPTPPPPIPRRSPADESLPLREVVVERVWLLPQKAGDEGVVVFRKEATVRLMLSVIGTSSCVQG